MCTKSRAGATRRRWLKGPFGPEELIAEGFDAATVERIVATVAANAFKRALEPPFPSAPFYD